MYVGSQTAKKKKKLSEEVGRQKDRKIDIF